MLDESNMEGEQAELPKVENPNDPHSFPLLTAIFQKAIGFINSIDQGLQNFDQSEFEVIEAIKKEQNILVYRILAIHNWTVNGLKDIRLKINEVFDVLDDWIVIYVKNENQAVNECIQKIREVIDSNEPLNHDLQIPYIDIQTEADDGIQFIDTIADKSFIQGKTKSKFNLNQAREYIDIFKKFARNEYISSEMAKSIFITNIKLNPDLVPQKWKENSLNYLENLVGNLEEGEASMVNWRGLLTHCILSESFSQMVNKTAVINKYNTSLHQAMDSEYEEYITLQKFLKIEAWFDPSLSVRSKDDVKFEEDKEEIDMEINDMKTLIYSINISQNGMVHIDSYTNSLLSLWPSN